MKTQGTDMTQEERCYLREIKEALSIVKREWVPQDHLSPGKTAIIRSLIDKGMITYKEGLIFLTEQGKSFTP